jgi:hypothetical protein
MIQLINKAYFKHVINALVLSKTTEEFIVEEAKARSMRK